MRFTVGQAGPPPGRRRRGPMTPLATATQPTHPAPASAPETVREEVWSAVSADGRWRYERLELEGTPWQVLHVASGQLGPDWYGTLDDAAEATAGDLAGRLLRAAVAVAFEPGPDVVEEHLLRRRMAHQWVGAHLLELGAVMDAWCRACGVAVTTALPDGRWAHLGASAEACADPAPVAEPETLTDFERRTLLFLQGHRMAAVPQAQHRVGTLAREIREAFDLSEGRFFQRVNQLLDKPAAAAAYPRLVAVLRADRERRIRGIGCR